MLSRAHGAPSSRFITPGTAGDAGGWRGRGTAGMAGIGKAPGAAPGLQEPPWQGSPCPRDTQPGPCQARSSFAGSGEEISRPLTRRRLEKGSSYFASWL